jgi:hypothetical protein
MIMPAATTSRSLTPCSTSGHIEATGAVIAGGTPLDAAARSGADDLVGWLRTKGARSATGDGSPGGGGAGRPGRPSGPPAAS